LREQGSIGGVSLPIVSPPEVAAGAQAESRLPPPATQPANPSEPLAEFGRTLREEFGRAFDRFSTLQSAASDELLLFGLAHPDLREEMLAILEHELGQAVDGVRRARRYAAVEGEGWSVAGEEGGAA
jgi:hypothetical protein